MTTVLITGGAGFIGANFVEHLFRRHPEYRLIVLDALTYAGRIDRISDEVRSSPRFEFWHGSVCNGELVSELMGQTDVVVHLAAESHVARSIFDNRVFYETDVLGTQAVANAVLRHERTVERFIHVSSSEVYGTASEIPMTEEHPLNPTTPYASAKAGADRLVSSYAITYGIPAVIVRPFNNYGPGQHLEKMVARFAARALRGAPLVVHGSGRNTRDWVFVEDTCRALDLAMHRPLESLRGRAVNLGSGVEHDVLDMAHRILRCLGKDDSSITFSADRPGQVARHCGSTRRAEELLGWRAAVDLDEGLERTVSWYREHEHWWKELVWMETVRIRTMTGDIEYH